MDSIPPPAASQTEQPVQPWTSYPPQTATLAINTPPVAAYPPQAPGYLPPPYGAPYAAPGYFPPPPAQRSRAAVTSLTFAILGAVIIALELIAGEVGYLSRLAHNPPGFRDVASAVMVASCVLTIGSLLALTCGILAVINGHVGLRDIEQSGDALSGWRAAQTGLILGYVEIAALIIGLVLTSVLFLLATLSVILSPL